MVKLRKVIAEIRGSNALGKVIATCGGDSYVNNAGMTVNTPPYSKVEWSNGCTVWEFTCDLEVA